MASQRRGDRNLGPKVPGTADPAEAWTSAEVWPGAQHQLGIVAATPGESTSERVGGQHGATADPTPTSTQRTGERVKNRVRLSVEQEALLDWAADKRVDLPWRSVRDPWGVLVSEVMLQQTQALRVVPKWEAFLAAYPTPHECASAPLADLVTLWKGLGYPRRARNLHRSAKLIVEHHLGAVPEDLDALLSLPGVGPYTARAVRAFAFEHDEAVLDTNVARVLARRCGRRLRPAEAQAVADEFAPIGRSWSWNQGMLDLGALVCRPGQPDCGNCPISASCSWHLEGRPDPDPAVGSASVSRPQARFAGSDRQLRGRMLSLLIDAPLGHDQLLVAVGLDADAGRGSRLIESLITDGLVKMHMQRLSLAT